jgi:large subunit ribosomal protein L24
MINLMQKKLHIKKGDQVIVNNGEYKGQKGRVLDVDRAKDRAIVASRKLLYTFPT